LRALDAVGETYTYRVVALDGTLVPPEDVTEQDLFEIRGDLEHLDTREPPSLEALLALLYTVSSDRDRSRIAPALDRLLEYVDCWSASAPERVDALFDQLVPSRIVRAVGQTLLAATRLPRFQSNARSGFLSRFLEDLRARGTLEATIDRLRRGLNA
jgi:hypothetical protein